MEVKKRYPEKIEGWDRFLFENYGCGIYEPCYCVAKEIILLSKQKEHKRQIRETEKYISKLKKQKEEKIEEGLGYHKTFWRLKKEVSDSNSDVRKDFIEFMVEWSGLQPHFKYLNSLIDSLQWDLKDLKDRVWEKRGRQVKTINKIACIFAEVIKNGGPDWGCIAEFLQWFFKSLENTNYQKIFDFGEQGDLRNEFYVIMGNEERRKAIENLADSYFLFSIGKSRWEPNVRIEFPKNYRQFFPADWSPAWEKRRSFFYPERIVFGKNHIRLLPPNDSDSLIKFTENDVTFRDVLNFKEAASFLGESPSSLLEKCKKKLIPYRPPNDRGIVMPNFLNEPLTSIQEKYKKEALELLELEKMITFSRRELMEWKRGPIKKKPRKAGKIFIDKKPRPKEEPIVIELTEEDVRGLKKYFENRIQFKKNIGHPIDSLR
jgi:hypothetical protein